MQEPNELREPLAVDYVRLLTAAALWGATFLNNEIALADFSPIAIASYRVIGGALLLLMVCHWRGKPLLLAPQTLGLLVIISMLNSVVPFILIGWGQLSVDSSTTGILLATSPFATLMLSHYFTNDDRFTWSKGLGLTLGFLGVCLLLGQGITRGDDSLFGMFIIMLAACCYAMSSILIRKLGPVSSLGLATTCLVIAGVVMLPVVLVTDPPWQQSYQPSSMAALAFLAVGPTAAGYLLRTQIVKLNGAVFMSNVGYLIPLFAVFWAWLFLGSNPTVTMFISLLLIFVGIAVGQNKLKTLLGL